MNLDQLAGTASPSTPLNTATAKANLPAAPVANTPAPSGVEPIMGAKAAQPAHAAPTMDEIQDAFNKIAEAIQPKAQDLRFSLEDETGRTIIKIIDQKTQTVLRQIPSEEMLEIAKSIDRMQGLLVRLKA